MLLNRAISSKRFHRVFRITGYAAIACLLIFTAVVLYAARSRQDGGMPRFLGRHMFPVLTENMEPHIPQGSLVAVQPREATDLQPGDVVTLHAGLASACPQLPEFQSPGNDIRFITWSEAEVQDPDFVSPEVVVGKVSMVLPWLGYLISYSQTKAGLLFLIFMPVKLVLAMGSRPLYLWVSKRARKWQIGRG